MSYRVLHDLLYHLTLYSQATHLTCFLPFLPGLFHSSSADFLAVVPTPIMLPLQGFCICSSILLELSYTRYSHCLNTHFLHVYTESYFIVLHKIVSTSPSCHLPCFIFLHSTFCHLPQLFITCLPLFKWKLH